MVSEDGRGDLASYPIAGEPYVQNGNEMALSDSADFRKIRYYGW
jgi:hypothetical protein